MSAQRADTLICSWNKTTVSRYRLVDLYLTLDCV